MLNYLRSKQADIHLNKQIVDFETTRLKDSLPELDSYVIVSSHANLNRTLLQYRCFDDNKCTLLIPSKGRTIW